MDRAAEGVGCACEREGQEFGLGGLITITMGAAKKKKKKKNPCRGRAELLSFVSIR